MDPSHHPPFESDPGPSAASSGQPEDESAVATSSSRSTWLQETFGEVPYATMEKLAPHRSLLIGRLNGILAPDVLMRIKHAQTDWDGITILALALSAPNPPLQATMKGLIRDLPELQEALQAASATRSSVSIPPAAVFPEPPICEGRDLLVAEIVAGVTEQGSAFRSAILHGVGGIGKSTVALKVLNHLQVISHFRGRRFFVGCENLSTFDGLVSRLATQLAVDTRKEDAKTAICGFGTSSPALLVLDNFEDLWNADGPATEPFLSSIAKVDGFNLIVTKRGRSEVRVPQMRSFAIENLDGEAALHAFIRHADRKDFRGESDPDLPELVNRLEGYPLALMLLAHQYDDSSGITAKQLLTTYERRRTDCLKRGERDARQTSLRASVDLSLASRAMSAEGAQELCFLLSLLPDGAEDELIDAFLGRIAPRFSSRPIDLITTKLAVVGVGLAGRSGQGLLRMLAPLRDLLASLDAVSLEARADARMSIHKHTIMLVELEDGIFRQKSAEDSAALRRRVTVQLGNLCEDIEFRLASEEPSEIVDAVYNAAGIACFVSGTVPYVPTFLSTAIARAQSRGLVQGEAECQRIRGEILLKLNRLDAARNPLARAMALYQDIGHRRGEGRTLQQFGLIAHRENDLPAAEKHLGAALAIAEETGHQMQKADTLNSLGDLAFRQDDLPLAQIHLDEALRVFRELGDQLGQANTLELLGNLARRQGNLTRAQTFLDEALALHRKVGSRLGAANTLESLGDLMRRQGDLDRSRVHLDEALKVYREIGSRLGEAHTLESLGDLARRQGDLPHAQVHLDEALGVSRDIGSRLTEANILESLGELARQQGDLPRSQSHFEEALKVHREISSRLGEGNALGSLGILALQQNNLTAAQAYIEGALAISQEIDNRLGETDALCGLGNLAWQQGDLSTARMRLENALALSEDTGYAWGRTESRRLLVEVAAQADASYREIHLESTNSHRPNRSFRSWLAKIPILRCLAPRSTRPRS